MMRTQMSIGLPIFSLLMSAPPNWSEQVAPPLAMVIPFVVMLLAVAVMPFVNAHWWEKYLPHVSLALGAVSVAYYGLVRHDWSRIAHVGLEYMSFIALIGSLFVVAGGILIRVKGESTPAINCAYLAIGAILANLIGTTGASMLLIRPWIRSNKYRITGFHIVFFIFVVSNVAGSLTPIGDPPLFLGYLNKVPFFWTLEHLWKPWLLTTGLLIGVFYVIDSFNFRRAPKEVRAKETAQEEWELSGMRNLIFLAVILGAIFLATPVREILMVGAAAASYFWTPKRAHEANRFTFAPIREVGWLFLGIFATMIPALHILAIHAKSLGIDTPMEFYWITGTLSGVLDNAPTYLTFLTTSISLHLDPVDAHRLVLGNAADVAAYIGSFPLELMAISLGAVFFGACTYIGNGPNFMVKSIADHEKIRTPDFFAYIWKYSLPILIPIFALVGWIFLRQ